MTQAFIDGFMSKCAEAGLDEKQAATLLRKQAGLGGLARSALRFAGRHPRVATLGGIAGGLGLAGALDNVVGSKLRPPRPLHDYNPLLNRKVLPALGNLEAYYHEFPEEADKFKNSFDDGLKRDMAVTAFAPNDYVYNPVGVGHYDFSPAVSNVAGRVIGNMPKQFQTPQMTNDVLNLFQSFRIDGDYRRPDFRSKVEGPTGSMWRPRLGDEALEPAPWAM